MEHTYITSDAEIRRMLDGWRSGGTDTVAVDFEGEFNLHCYGEHLCLVQIFDGKSFFLVDPLAGGVTADGLRPLLESKDILKLWFDCASDGELAWKKHRIRLANVYDLRLESRMLGMEGSLSSLVSLLVEGKPEGGRADGADCARSKKRLQQTNWMRRPLSPQQLDYALRDVAHLFALRAELDRIAGEQGRLEEVLKATAALPRIRTREEPPCTKLPGFRRLTREQQVYARHFFNARDELARRLNLPAFRVLDKRVLTSLARKPPLNQAHLRAELSMRNKKTERLLLPLMMEAKAAAEKEIAGLPPKPKPPEPQVP